ncbi:hypothetical protein JKF63_02846 [Porcisia hertigi]|uniref:Uncharacterized protein n=1 Tax=Porcisia hertigi TaxID=2761500 RepID=A0A836L862_9TRYP|nr:hypothetical protein JKF63_02846 [Porcisia hertigi]
MSDASQRARQQRRIQQLHERLELYNITDRHADPTSTSAGGVGFASTAGQQPDSAGKASATKPSRTAPAISSSSLTSTSDPTSSTFSFTSSLPSRATKPGVPSFTLGPQRGKDSGATTAASASGMAEGSWASPAPQLRPQAKTQNPTPAPQLARSLAEEFVGSAASPTRASPIGGASQSPLMPRAGAASAVAPGRTSNSAAFPESDAEAAESATATNTGPPRQASNVFAYYEESESDQSENVEYDVEEVEEVEEFTEDEANLEEDRKEHTIKAAALTLEKMLQRLHHACSDSSQRAAVSSSLKKAVAAAASFSLACDPPLGSAAPQVAPAAAAAATSPVSASHPFLQQAAELYRQRHLCRAAQAQQHSDHLNTGHAFSTDEELSVTTSTSDPTGELDGTSESRSASESSSAAAPWDGHGVATTAPAAAQNADLSNVALESIAAATSAIRTALDAAGSGNALPSSALCFDQLEVAYRRLLILQEGVQYISERAGPERFPHSLPRQEDAHGLGERRDIVVKRDSEMRAAPPAGVSLEDLRQHENVSIRKTLESMREKFDIAMRSLKPVADRESLLEGKRRVLKQRELDITKQREARLVVEREVAATEQRLAKRSEQLKKREEDYNARLQQHDQQQKAAQERISEVEQLSKQVSSWLSILEERDRRLTVKEKRLQRIQADLTKRTEDIIVWRRATQRIKQIPPPPSPPPVN